MTEHFEFKFTPTGENRTVYINLPEGYENGTERYCVLYMFDGQMTLAGDDDRFLKILGEKGIDVITVGVPSSSKEPERLSEYSPYDVNARILGEIKGTGAATAKWLVEELKPYIDATYRTYPDRDDTAIGGFSMGGIEALYTALVYNDIFSRCMAISPAIYSYLNGLRDEISEMKLQPAGYYVSWGGREYNAISNQALGIGLMDLQHDILDRGARMMIKCFPNGRHNMESWSSQLPEIIDWLFLS